MAKTKLVLWHHPKCALSLEDYNKQKILLAKMSKLKTRFTDIRASVNVSFDWGKGSDTLPTKLGHDVASSIGCVDHPV